MISPLWLPSLHSFGNFIACINLK
uniref:Uncharacterized protein n=1 Tax=Anguilla anguilla TaxID=7936 RepID=A0A0E9T284_ANGAN